MRKVRALLVPRSRSAQSSRFQNLQLFKFKKPTPKSRPGHELLDLDQGTSWARTLKTLRNPPLGATNAKINQLSLFDCVSLFIAFLKAYLVLV